MIEHFELKSYTYEQSRLMFFREKRQNAKRRLRYWKNRAINGSYNSLQAGQGAESELSYFEYICPECNATVYTAANPPTTAVKR